MHLTETELAALVHGEHEAGHSGWAHLQDCEDCASQLRTLREDDAYVGQQLSYLDHVAPAALGDWMPAVGHSHRARPAAIAAALAVCVVGAAAALPVSPLHRLLLRAVGTDTHRAVVQPARTTPPIPASKAAVSFTAGPSLEIRFLRAAAGDAIRIRLVDGPQMSASATSDAGFSISRTGLDIDDRGIAQAIVLEVPRSSNDVRIVVGGKIIFSRRGSVVISTGAQDDAGDYVLQLGSVSGNDR